MSLGICFKKNYTLLKLARLLGRQNWRSFWCLVWKTKSWYKSKPTWKLKHANSILETFWEFLPNIIKINLCNYELYRFKVGAFFWDTVYNGYTLSDTTTFTIAQYHILITPIEWQHCALNIAVHSLQSHFSTDLQHLQDRTTKNRVSVADITDTEKQQNLRTTAPEVTEFKRLPFMEM